MALTADTGDKVGASSNFLFPPHAKPTTPAEHANNLAEIVRVVNNIPLGGGWAVAQESGTFDGADTVVVAVTLSAAAKSGPGFFTVAVASDSAAAAAWVSASGYDYGAPIRGGNGVVSFTQYVTAGEVGSFTVEAPGATTGTVVVDILYST